MHNDIENQFCIIDEVDNCISNNDLELINLTNSTNSINSTNLTNSKKSKNPINKFKKSKSYPNEILSNHIDNKEIIVNIINKDKLNNIEKKNINGLNYDSEDNSNIDSNLIENKNIIQNFIGRLKKICNYSIYSHCCDFFNLPIKINKIEVLNKFLTICLHIFIMVIFETYFYFNYVIWIEKDEFLDQINKYLSQLNSIPIDSTQKKIISFEINSNSAKYNTYLDYLYNQYINSLSSQKKLLHKLLIKACTMAGIVGLIFIILFIIGLVNRKKIKWNWIWIENLLMFLFLGIFEYFFFMTIIMHYNPITDAEVKYYLVDGIIKYFNTTS